MKKCAPFSKDSPPFKAWPRFTQPTSTLFPIFPLPFHNLLRIYPRCERGLNSPFLFSLLSSLHSFSPGVKTTPKLDDGQKQPSSTRKACSFLHPHLSPSFPLRLVLVAPTRWKWKRLCPSLSFLAINLSNHFQAVSLAYSFFANFRRREQSTTDKLLFTSANTFRWLRLSFNINVIQSSKETRRCGLSRDDGLYSSGWKRMYK